MCWFILKMMLSFGPRFLIIFGYFVFDVDSEYYLGEWTFLKSGSEHDRLNPGSAIYVFLLGCAWCLRALDSWLPAYFRK